jgi:hypothetical protein
LEQGVFTHFLLEGIRGGAMSPMNDGFIRLGTVSSYAAQATRDWVAKNKKEVQEPWFEGELARNIPLAVDQRVAQQQEAQRAADAQLNQRRNHALDLLTEARKVNRDVLSGKLEDDVTAAVQSSRGLALGELLEQLEDLADPKPARVRSFVAWWNARPVTPRATNILSSLLYRGTNTQLISVTRPTNAAPTSAARPYLTLSVANLQRGLDGKFCDKLQQVLDARASGFESLKGEEATHDQRIPIRVLNARLAATYPEWVTQISFINAQRATIMEAGSSKVRTFRVEYPADAPGGSPRLTGILDALQGCLGQGYVRKEEPAKGASPLTITFTPLAGEKPVVTVRSSTDSMVLSIPGEAAR